MIVEEKAMLKMLDKAKKVQLIEPAYPRKYPPLGLAKIMTYLTKRGTKFDYNRAIHFGNHDLICVTSLFTYYSKYVFDVLDAIQFMYPDTPVLVGGVFASILPDEIAKRYPSVNIFRGYSKELDRCVPYREIDFKVEDPWDTFSYVFTSRGCPNKCAYCTVWRIEKERWVNPTWKEHIDLTKPNIMISDNNLSAVTFDHLKEIVNLAVENKKKILFDNGFDCKYITKEMAVELAKLKFVRQGMRMAFDRIEEDGTFQNAVKILQDAGVPKHAMMAYVLFNFMDRPQDADYRMRECFKLGVRPYPQYYRPLTTMNKKEKFIGKHWTERLGKAMRYFWLMRGLHSEMTFEEYINSEKCKPKLKKKDFKMWKNNGVTK